MKAVVIAGGEGKSLRPVTCTVSKSMINIMGKPVLGYIIDLLSKNGFDEIAVTTRYLSEDIENFIEESDYDFNIYTVCEENISGTAGSVKNAAKDWQEPFLVINGDCICDIELSKVMLYHKSVMADVTVVCSTSDNPCDFSTVNLNRNGSIDSFCEKPDWSHTSSDLVNTGIYVINPAVLEFIPDNVQYDFVAHLFPEMLQEGKRLYGYQTDNAWYRITDIKSVRHCIKELMTHKTNVTLPIGKNGLFAADKIPEGDFSVVPPVYFGRNVTVGSNCVIGPFTVLNDGVSVADNSRIKKSVIGNNSVIGANCDLIGSYTGSNCVIKSNTVCLEGSCIGDGCTVNSGSTVSNNVFVWPGKILPYRSVLLTNLRDGQNEYTLLNDDGISGVTFSELSCEKCCRLGEALASSTCGGKVGIGYDGTKSSKALAMAVLSGLIAGGSKISDFGVCFGSQMGFFVSFCSLDSGIYISATDKKADIKLFGEYGLPLSRKAEREIESRYKHSDFRRNCNAEKNELHDMSSVADIYDGKLLTLAGESVSGTAFSVRSTNSMIRHAAEKCMFLLGASSAELPEFSVDYSGRSVVAKDETGAFADNDRLLMICGIDAVAENKDVCVPFTAPWSLNKLIDSSSAQVYRVGCSPMSAFSADVATAARRCLWAFDGLSLVFRVAGIMKKRKKTLSQLLDELPEMNIVRKTISLSVPDFKVAAKIGADVGNDSQGIRKVTDKGSVTVTRCGAGRLLRITAEAVSMEAAEEICSFTEKKINGDTIDIYHHKV